MIADIDDIACDAVRSVLIQFAGAWFATDELLVLLDAARDEGIDEDRTARRSLWLRHYAGGISYATHGMRVGYLRAILEIK